MEERHNIFKRLAEKTAKAVGSAWAFVAAVGTIFIWAVTGPLFGFSDTWQLVINTGTTIITFLIVFLIQNTQNRETKIISLKLDELLRDVEGARTGFISLEKMSDTELEEVHKEFERLKEDYAPLIAEPLAAIYAERRHRGQKSRKHNSVLQK